MVQTGVETGLRVVKMCGARPLRDLLWRRTWHKPWWRRTDCGLVLDVIGVGIFWRPGPVYEWRPNDG